MSFFFCIRILTCTDPSGSAEFEARLKDTGVAGFDEIFSGAELKLLDGWLRGRETISNQRM